MAAHIRTAWQALQSICLLTLATLLPQPAFPQQRDAPPGRLEEQLDRLMTAYTSTGLFNGSVLISKAGKTLLVKGYGYSNLAAGTLNTATTKYPVYSITKSMTAALILQLAERKLLTLDERLSRFYPTYPAADSMTISQLLTHTSGLYPYNNDYSMPTDSEEAMVRFLAGRALEFKPGSQWQYCNTGYYLLGFIVEKTTGLPYGKALDSLLFRPLKMNASGLDFRSLEAAGKATGYRFLYPGSGREARLYPQEELRSSGGVWSTVEDMLKFHEGMQHHRIISPASTRQAYTPYQKSYGYGWFIDSADGRQIVSHSGGAAGFRSLLVRIPDSNTCIVLLANAENVDLAVIKDGILRLLSGKDYEVPHSVEVDSARLSAIAGTYRLEPGRSLYIKSIHRRLVAQVSGQQPALLLADSSGRFRVAGMNGHLEFMGRQPGLYDSVALFRKDRRHLGVRVNATWGIAGSALPGGWSAPDIVMLPANGQPGVWTAMNVRLLDGVIKFRFNNDWTFNLGAAPGSKMLEDDGPDIAVKAGTYTISLHLQASTNPVFIMRRE